MNDTLMLPANRLNLSLAADGFENTTTTNDDYVFEMYSDGQKMALAWITYPVTLASLLGSLTILYVIFCDYRAKLQTSVFYRLMVGLSVMDSIASLGLFCFGSWAVPEGSTVAWGERGTIATCNVAGFFFFLMSSSGLYMAFLAIYHVLVVRYQIQDETIATRLEPIFHVVAIGTPVVLASVAIWKDYVNPLYAFSGYCFVADFPPRCARDENDDTPLCIRGGDMELFKSGVYFTIFLFAFLTIFICMILMTWTVWTAEQRTAQYSVRNSATQLKLTKQTARQGLLYIGSFFLSFIWSMAAMTPLLNLPATPESATTYFVTSFLAKLFMPLMGFFNAIIFVRPRYQYLTSKGQSLQFVKDLCCCRMKLHDARTSNCVSRRAVAHTTSTLDPVFVTNPSSNLRLTTSYAEEEAGEGRQNDACLSDEDIQPLDCSNNSETAG